jgi:hypothetical protein
MLMGPMMTPFVGGFPQSSGAVMLVVIVHDGGGANTGVVAPICKVQQAQ